MRDSTASRSKFDRGMGEIIEVLLRGLRPEIAAQDLLEKQIGLGPGLNSIHARLESSDEIERLEEFVTDGVPARTRECLLHRERDPQIGGLADREAGKPRAGNAHQRVVVR